MYSNEDIESAVNAGIISSQTAYALRKHIESRQKTSAVDEEHFRLITGFNDIFVVIASLLLLVSTEIIVGKLHDSLGLLASATMAWGLSEYFIRKRCMALPAIILSLAFVISVGLSSVYLVQNPSIRLFSISLLMSLAAWCHWRRFHVPITVAAGTGAVACGFLYTLWLEFPEIQNNIPLFSMLIFLIGLLVFSLAMYWDALDIQRQTRRTDVAFWLHLLAAPLLVHPVFIMIGVTSGELGLLQMVLVLIIYILIALLSLTIDRRALMVSALGYVLYVFTSLLNKTAVEFTKSFALVAFVLGAALLLLSVFWHQSRRWVLCLLPSSVARYIPPCKRRESGHN